MIRFARKVLAVVIALSSVAPVFGGESSSGQAAGGLDSRYLLGVGVGVARFDTSIEISDPASGNSIFFDGEGSLGLPETQSAPILYGSARINAKHGLEFHTFRMSRDGTALAVERDFGRLNVDGSVAFADRTHFTYLAWQYRLFDDGQTLIRSRVGVYFMDLKYEVQAVGQLSLDGIPLQSGEYQDTLNLFAPLPLLGVDYWSRISDRWHVGGEFTFVAGSYNDAEALVFNVALRTRRQLTERLAAELGLNILSADAEVTRPNTVRDIKYGYEGVYVGLDFGF